MAQQTGSAFPVDYRLHQAAERGDLELIRSRLSSVHEDVSKILLSAPVKDLGEHLFHGAARGGHINVLELVLPETLQHLTDTQSSKGGWSPLHLAAAYGRANVVHWLLSARKARLDLRDEQENTPMHLAVARGHKDVVRHLVNNRASLFDLNIDRMMPISLCKDPAMFEALFSNYTVVSTRFNTRCRPIGGRTWPLDAEKRNILHYAAQFATDPNRIANLIDETDPDKLLIEDECRDSFLHVAAKSGNVHVLRGLKILGIDVKQLVSDCACDHLHSPGMYALLNNHRDFFDELIAMAVVEVTLSHIIQVLMEELIDKPEIEDRLVLFASTLPTYLALYANKECIFNFLLETKVVSISQWDDKHKRTCLHWAVIDNRIDIVQKICEFRSEFPDAQLRPGIQDADGKTALQHAFEKKNHMIMDTLRSKHGFKEYEKKLEKDREIYVQALNAILVGAALIASVTFAGWLQLPSKEFGTLAMKMFWASNCISFFTAVATMCVTITALIPTPRRYVGNIVNQLRLAIVMDAGLLALSLAAVTWAFAAAGFAALHDVHIFSFQGIMRSTTAVGGFLCLIVWIAFVLHLYECAPSKSTLFVLLVPSPLRAYNFSTWGWAASYQKLHDGIGLSSRFSYESKSRADLKRIFEEDLVECHIASHVLPPGGTHGAPTSNIIPIQNMRGILDEIGITDTGNRFIENVYKQKEDEISYKKRKESANSRIIHHLNDLLYGA